MNWINFLWPMVTGACLTLGLINLRIAFAEKPRAARLLFSLSAFAVAMVSVAELAMMRAETPARYLTFLKWGDFAAWLTLSSLTAFIWIFFKAGNKWLALSGSALYGAGILCNLRPGSGLVFSQITGLRTMTTFGGATYHVAEGVPNPWNALAYIAVLLILIFAIGASVRLWRRGARSRAVFVGGGLVFFLLAGGIHSGLIEREIIRSPYLVSWFYLAILIAMGHELTREVFAATLLGRELRESEMRMSLAAEAANLGVWIWDISRDDIWLNKKGRALLGFADHERIDLGRLLQTVHDEDRANMEELLRRSLARGGDYEGEYRLAQQPGGIRWVAGYGRVEEDAHGKAIVMRGVTREITKRKLAEESTRTSEELNRTVLASLHNQIAILDRTGTIVAVNDAWKQFALMNGGVGSSVSVGVNYLDVCRCSASAGDGTARRTLEGVQSVLEGASEFFEIEYPCHSPSEPRWFLARVVPLKTPEGGAVVSHAEVTRLKLAEEALRESEARFRTVADVAPVMIWMSGPDKLCNFFNKGWLEFTGRTRGGGIRQRLGRRRELGGPRPLSLCLWESV